jgi:hypothetical protein
MWELRRLTALWASTACYRDTFTLLYIARARWVFLDVTGSGSYVDSCRRLRRTWSFSNINLVHYQSDHRAALNYLKTGVESIPQNILQENMKYISDYGQCPT